MKFYTATRTIYRSPEYKYFDSIEHLNDKYGIDSTIDDYNKGYTFEYNGQTYLLGYD